MRFLPTILLCALTMSRWGILNGKTQLRSSCEVGPTVPAEAGGAGAVPIRMLSQIVLDDTLNHVTAVDSLELCTLQLDIRKAEERVNETSLWRRLIPQIYLSASFGIHDMMFIDPASFTPYVLPRDAYRLTMSISLNDVLISPPHAQAIIDLERLKAALSVRTILAKHARKTLVLEMVALDEQSESLQEELSIVRDLLHFNELRFQQGGIEFDVLARTRLELLGVQRSIQRVQQQQSVLRLKLRGQ
jgi:hypothetical protein